MPQDATAKPSPSSRGLLAQHPDDGEVGVLEQNAEILAQGLPVVHLPFIGSLSGSDEIDAVPQLHGAVVAQDLINRDGGINGAPARRGSPR